MNDAQSSISRLARTPMWAFLLFAVVLALAPTLLDVVLWSRDPDRTDSLPGGSFAAVWVPFSLFSFSFIHSLCCEVDRLRRHVEELERPTDTRAG